MAKLERSRGRRDEDSGYGRLFGNRMLGHLLSQVHATVIRTGNELEKLLAERTTHPLVLAAYVLENSLLDRSPIEVVCNQNLRLSDGTVIKPDFIIVNHTERTCRIVEVKDGDTFDTKKSSGELASLQHLVSDLSGRLGYTTNFYFCAFNQPSKAAIVAGAKGRFDLNQVMTGRELCELLGIDYDEIVEYRCADQQGNLSYFLDQLLEIEEVRTELTTKLDNNQAQRERQ